LPVFSTDLFLPVANKQPVGIELVSVVSPPGTWTELRSTERARIHTMMSALGTLAQMKLADGSSLSMTGIDTTRREVPFEQKAFLQLDTANLEKAFKKAADGTVSVAALAASQMGAAFLRETLMQRLNGSPEIPRLVIVASSSFVFERGSDVEPIEMSEDCRCIVYHLRFRHGLNDAFDDIGRLLRELRPTTFNIANPHQFRTALAEIVKDLETIDFSASQ
jgi:hypothetical protein